MLEAVRRRAVIAHRQFRSAGVVENGDADLMAFLAAVGQGCSRKLLRSIGGQRWLVDECLCCRIVNTQYDGAAEKIA